MNTLTATLQSRWAHIFSGVFLALIYASFAYAHMLKFLKTHDWPLLLFCFSETLVVAFYIFREKPKTISVNPLDWLVAIGGTFMPLFFRPALWGVLPLAKIAIITGAFFQILSMISLNRSFALVAAKREIKTAWMYRIVRHPLYASYCLIFIGYVLTNTTLYNVLVYLLAMGFLCIRIFQEEKHLALDPLYREYMLKVRYRIIPFIF
ncbi:MAG: methyltransferase [Methylococcales bacterium]|nr:methyltransferase [Methylococcales bacterium]